MPVPEADMSSDDLTNALNSQPKQEETNGDKVFADLEDHLDRENQSSEIPCPDPPPNSARTVRSRRSKIRLVHSAPKSAASNKENATPATVAVDAVHNNGQVEVHESDTITDESPQPKFTAMFFNIAQSKDINQSRSNHVKHLPVDVHAKENNLDIGANILNYKPGFLRSPSPRKVQFLEGYYRKAKLVNVEESKDDDDDYNSETKSPSSVHSKRADVRRNFHPSTCEAVHLTDLKQKYGNLNKSKSKSAQILSVAPRPVAGFPSKPAKTGSFILSRRKSGEELRKHKSQMSLTTNVAPKSSGISVYSFDNLSKSVDHNSNASANSKLSSRLPSLEDWKESNSPVVENNDLPRKIRNNNIIEDSQVPFNSCKTSAIGSDVMLPESRLATRGTIKPWSDTCSISVGGDSTPDEQDSNYSRMDLPIMQKPLMSEPLTTTYVDPNTPRTNASMNAFRPSKSVHMLNSSQAYANYQIKNKKDKKNNAIIMDIFKKKGIKESQSPVSRNSKNDQSPDQSIGLRNESSRRKPRSRSLGRDGMHHHNENEKKKCVCSKCSSILLSQEATREKINPLAVLASRGGRGVVFGSRFGYRLVDRSPENHSPESRDRSPKRNDTIKISAPPFASKSETQIEAEKRTTPPVSILKPSSTFKEINHRIVGQPPGGQSNTEVMFDASHYTGFQHAKFNNKSHSQKNMKSDFKKEKTAGYNEELKAKFLKVSIGGDGFNGVPSEKTEDSPRSLATSEFTLP